MKKLVLFLLAASPLAVMAQQTVNNAVIKIKMETTSDNTGGGDGGAVIQMAGQETDITAYFKDSLRKVTLQNNFMNSTTIYDGRTGTSTVLTESMGEKTGYTQNEAQRQEQRRRMDSAMKARESEESGPGRMVVRFGGGSDKTIDIAYTEETKVINKINCKKAIITTQSSEGTQKKTEVWYTADYILPVGVNISGRGGINFAGFKGMPVMYEQSNTMNINGTEMTMTTHYEVKSIETGKNIEDKEFNIPKGYTVKTWEEYLKENPDGMPMRRVIRMGN